ncbi:hypothetical protein GCM10022377_09960 [Zhihengliuella alba]|uniref:HTH cro/C1-type domain-containing protein n=1 Tax=Zhihengliuella alba TaxID=547018 RepID=A0ABP7D0F1_9MICC
MQQGHAGSPEELFGRVVAMIRKHENLSQREFAERLTRRGMPVDASAVSRIEKGTRSVRLVEALVIAEVLDVDLNTLAGLSETPGQSLRHARKAADRAMQEALPRLVAMGWALLDAQDLLDSEPSLLEQLTDDAGGGPRDAEDYLAWVARRISEWDEPKTEEHVVVTGSDERTARMRGVYLALIDQVVTTAGEAEGGDGERQEEA